MSRRFRIVVEYDGTDFSGWQRQLGQRTVQATLEDAIRDMTGETVFVRGAGRTDAGVHADGQVGTFDLALDIPPHGLLRGLNSILPTDVAIVDVAEAAPDFDARFSARGKIYRYTVWNHFVRSPRLRAHRLARAPAAGHRRDPARRRVAGGRARLPRLSRLRLRPQDDQPDRAPPRRRSPGPAS